VIAVPIAVPPAPDIPIPAPVPVPPAPAIPVPAPAPAPQPPFPLAWQPFSPNWPVHYMGKMDVPCSDCGALHWSCEKLAKSSQADPKFGMCCFSGKIKLPKLNNPPQELLNLLSAQDPASKKFRDHIRSYNNALAMTSLGCDQDKSIHGGGPYVFKVQGRVYHRIGSLIPLPGKPPLYAQLYIYDPQEALHFRMNHLANAALDIGTMQILQDMLYRHHPGVQFYKQALELTQGMGPDQQCKIALHFDENTDHCRYNLPTQQFKGD